MPELAEVQPQKSAGFVDRGYNYDKKRKRIEDEEEEIKRLEAQQRGEESESVEEETSETEETNTEVEEATLSAEERSFKKRYGDLRRHMQEKEKEWNDKFDIFEKRMEKESIVPPKSDEDIEQWAKQYPDVAGIVETIAAKKAQEMFSKADARLQELDNAKSEAERVKAENAIRKSHDDFDDLRASDEFHNWAEEQPKWVQDALYENADDPASVVRVIDLYKGDKGLTKTAKKAKAKDAASTVTRRGKASVDVEDANDVIRESDVAKMSDRDFEAKADEINKAIRSGKFVYDVSGNAR
jgi:hypothetical protein|tara:strand:+ start:1958 stop:2851 length:894 start_codon:yes stop_codon:yes gene_type:complete